MAKYMGIMFNMCVGHACTCVFTHAWGFYPYTHPTPRPRGYQITKNAISLELVDVIYFWSKIYEVWRLHYLWVDVSVARWVDVWGHVKSQKMV